MKAINKKTGKAYPVTDAEAKRMKENPLIGGNFTFKETKEPAEVTAKKNEESDKGSADSNGENADAQAGSQVASKGATGAASKGGAKK